MNFQNEQRLNSVQSILTSRLPNILRNIGLAQLHHKIIGMFLTGCGDN